MKPITDLLKQGIVLGDGGYLIKLERRGCVDSGSRREKVGTGKGGGQFTPEVAIEDPEALRELQRALLQAGSQVLPARTLFATREKLNYIVVGCGCNATYIRALTDGLAEAT
jgi:betaine-homocysteine S-methyltransferase